MDSGSFFDRVVDCTCEPLGGLQLSRAPPR
jgi:hypothetical protein